MKTAVVYDMTLYEASYAALAAAPRTVLYNSDEEVVGETVQLDIVKHIERIRE